MVWFRFPVNFGSLRSSLVRRPSCSSPFPSLCFVNKKTTEPWHWLIENEQRMRIDAAHPHSQVDEGETRHRMGQPGKEIFREPFFRRLIFADVRLCRSGSTRWWESRWIFNCCWRENSSHWRRCFPGRNPMTNAAIPCEKSTESTLPLRDTPEEEERRILLVHRSIPTGILHNKRQDDRWKILDTSFHWSEDSEKNCPNMPRLFANWLVASEETRFSVTPPSFPCSMNRPSRSEEDWAPAQPHSLGFLSIITLSVRRRLTRLFSRLPSILSFIGVTWNSEDPIRQISNQRNSSGSIHRVSQGNRRRTPSKVFSPSKRSIRTFPLSITIAIWQTRWRTTRSSMNSVNQSNPLLGRIVWKRFTHSSLLVVVWCQVTITISRTFFEEIRRLDLSIGHMIKGKGKETSAIDTGGRRIQVKRQMKRNISGRECDNLFSPLTNERTNERTNEGVFVSSRERRYLLIAESIRWSFCVKLKERRVTTCHEWVTFMRRHFFIEDNGNVTDGETNQALPSFLSLSLSCDCCISLTRETSIWQWRKWKCEYSLCVSALNRREKGWARVQLVNCRFSFFRRR